MNTAFICDESYFWHDVGSAALFEPACGYVEKFHHVENPERVRRVKNLLERSGLMNNLVQVKPIPATHEQLQYFHTARHIENVKRLSESSGGDCGESAIVGQGSYEIAKLAAGGAIQAVKAVVQSDTINSAYALTRPPGHHAVADQGVSFCIFNNVVLAAKYAQKELGIKKILILDWDAHHGNGIEDAFYDDNSVLFISLHQEGYDPEDRGGMGDIGKGAGQGFNINIPLYAGSGDAVYKYAFEQIVVPVTQRFAPELILVAAGQDGNFFDPLSHLMLTTEGYRHMTRTMKNLTNNLVLIHEGGYCPTYVPFCTHAIIEELSGITTDVGDSFIDTMIGTTYNTLLPHQKERIDGYK